MRAFTLTHLSDAVLLRDLAALVAQERTTTAAPTMLQTPPVWTLSRGAELVDQADLVLAHLDPLDQGANQLAAQYPVGLIETMLHAAGELVQLSDHPSQRFFLSSAVGALLGRGFELSVPPSAGR